MRKLLSIIVLGLLLSGNAYASPFKTTWVIEKYIGSGAYSDPEEGAFFNCDYGGLVSDYATYTNEEFFNNKQFKFFLQQKSKLNFPINKKIYVEKLTCADNKTVLFPFIQFEDEEIAFYEFDMVIYQLKKK